MPPAAASSGRNAHRINRAEAPDLSRPEELSDFCCVAAEDPEKALIQW